MGLFQKKPMVSTSAPGYHVQPTQTILIIGLGNPGKEYKLTRHNLGFEVLDELAKQLEVTSWASKKIFSATMAEASVADKRLILGKPDTFVNNSGQTVSALKKLL